MPNAQSPDVHSMLATARWLHAIDPPTGNNMKSSARSTASTTALLLVAASFAAGCSLQPRPTDELAQARVAVTQAVDAAVPGAQGAQTKVVLAQRWIDAKDYGPARWLAEQAEVDAELALARAAHQEARRALERNQQRLAIAKASSMQVSLSEKSK